jgi:hypothetical protein
MARATDVHIADRLAKRRALTCLLLSGVLFLSQGASIDLTPSEPFPALYSEAFYLWLATLALLLVLATGRFRAPAVRAMVNDDATVDHRRRALGVGFWAALATSAVIWCIAEAVTGAEASRLIVTVAACAALLRFGWLEWKSLR